MKRFSVLFLALCPAAAFCAGGYLLQSELLTQYNPGAKKTFTGYSYDANGNRIDKRVYDGVDTLAALMSRVKYVYDADKRVSEEILVAAAGDTLAMVRYAYSVDGITSIATLNGKGDVRFKDSLLYTSGLLSEQRRYTGAATTPLYYHRYSYAGKLLSADSMYEAASGGGFAATQALLITRNADSSVSTEARWRVSGAQWYCISTTKMLYSQKLLLSATMFETDGTSGRLMDSLAYACDTHGNRTKEEHFDADRVRTYDIVFTWISWPPTQTVSTAITRPVSRHAYYRDGRIAFGERFTGTVAVYTAGGRKVCERRVDNGDCATLQLSAASGRYIAAIDGTIKQSLSFTINN